VGQLILTWLKK